MTDPEDRPIDHAEHDEAILQAIANVIACDLPSTAELAMSRMDDARKADVFGPDAGVAFAVPLRPGIWLIDLISAVVTVAHATGVSRSWLEDQLRKTWRTIAPEDAKAGLREAMGLLRQEILSRADPAAKAAIAGGAGGASS